jgi:glycine oxidase
LRIFAIGHLCFSRLLARYNKNVKSPDVIVAGAGIIGISVALEFRRRGAVVLVLDRGEPGQESTSAAAGMLAAADPETPPALRTLCLASARLYTEYVQRIESASGMGVDFRTQGTIRLADDSSLPAGYRRLSREELQQMEPSLRSEMEASFVHEDSVDPSLLVQAALWTAWSAGIDVRSHSEVREIVPSGPYVEVVVGSERLQAANVIDCRGAWSGAPVRPRKGHSLYVQPKKTRLLEHAIVSPEVYLVPRSSGKILIGATVEDVGYDKTVRMETIQLLRSQANMLVPELGAAAMTESWAGLRPGTPDDLPLLGATEARGVYVASGHFRNGILLAPATAQIMADLISGKSPQWEISAFSPSRFTAASAGGTTKTQRSSGNS